MRNLKTRILMMGAAAALWAGQAMAEVRSENLWWLPENISQRMHASDQLFMFIFWLTGAVCVATQFLLVYYCVKYRYSRRRKAVYSHGNNTFEVVWTVIPTLIFIALFVWSTRLWNNIHTPPPADALQVESVAEQFGFAFRYPGPDGKLARATYGLVTPENKLGIDANDPAGADDFQTYNEFVVPVNRPVHVLMRSRDVIHAFYVPQLRLFQDMVPGRTIDWVWFIPEKTGNYEVACSQLCGVGHYNMKAKFKVVTAEEYEQWAAGFAKPGQVALKQ